MKDFYSLELNKSIYLWANIMWGKLGTISHL